MKLMIFFAKFRWLFLLLVLSTVIYVGFYVLVVSNPDVFLTESSSTVYEGVEESSNSTEIEIPLAHSVSSIVVHWGWLNYCHEKHVLTVALLCLSVFLCSYFRPLRNPAKGDTAQTVRQRLIKHKLGNTFAVYGLFVILWATSLMFFPMTGYDSVLSLALILIAMFLLTVSGIYLTVETQKAVGKRKVKIGNALTILGIFLAVWFTVSTFLTESIFALISLSFIFLIGGYFLSKLLKSFIKKVEAEV